MNLSEVVEIQDEAQFRQFISQDRAVVNFTAPSWCAPCRALEPRYAVAASQTDVPFATVDADKFTALIMDYMIMSVPTVIEFSSGNIVGAIGGRTAPDILSSL